MWHITPYSTHTVLAPCVSEHLSNVHNRPSNRGGLDLFDFSESPTDPPGGGGWTLEFERANPLSVGGAGGTK